MYRVVLADDNEALRNGVKMILAGRDDFPVRGEAADGFALLKLLATAPPLDIAIIDLSMPGLCGIDAIREIRKTNEGIRLLVLTMHKEEGFLIEAFIAGADGYLLKEDMVRELIPALEAVISGRCYLSRSFAREAPDAWLNVFIARKAFASAESLSPGDIKFVEFLARGGSSSDIAHKMAVSKHAVTSHRAEIMRKLLLTAKGQA